MNRRMQLALVAATLWATTGCAQVRGKISAESVRAPVSLTKAVYDAHGNTLTLGKELETVGQFDTTTRFVSAFYGLALPTWTWDASEFLNRQLDRHGGEAIVDLTIETEEPNGGETLLAYLSQASPLIPIWIKVRMRGKVVRRTAKQP